MALPDHVVHIVPRMKPVTCGIADYSVLLAGEMRARLGFDSRFIVCTPGWRQDDTTRAFTMHSLARRTLPEFSALLERAAPEPDAVVYLHYVPHGYALRACPFWLIRGLRRWKRGARRIVTLFHEVYGTGPIWSSGFWTSRIQYWLATRVAAMSDRCRCTTDVGVQLIKKMVGPARAGGVTVLPVFSTLGEPESVPPPQERQRQLVLFGAGRWKSLAYGPHAADLLDACRRLGIERIIDIGERVPPPPGFPLPIDQLGFLDHDAASAIFSGSLAGYFTYEMPFLAKSTIFAAYCAHGMVPVTFRSNIAANRDGVRLGEHALTADGIDAGAPEQLARVADAAHRWYLGHRLAVCAESVVDDVRACA